MNSINLIGNLGSDPEIRYIDSGQSVAKFSIAVQRRFKKDKKDWFSCEVWGKSAQAPADHLKKGHKVAISGELNIEQYKNKEGQEKTIVVVKVDSFDFLTPKPQGSEPQGYGGNSLSDF